MSRIFISTLVLSLLAGCGITKAPSSDTSAVQSSDTAARASSDTAARASSDTAARR